MRRFARPYAQAALAVAGSPEKGAMLRDQLAAFQDALGQSAQLQMVVASPALPVDVKHTIVAKVADALHSDPLTRRLLDALLSRHRLQHVAQVVDALTAELNRRQGIAVAELRTAEPLADDEKAVLVQVLERRVGKKLEVRTAVDPALIAGFVAQVDSELFDGSLRGQLDRLAKELAEA